MRYRIEYLREPTEQHSVCHVRALQAETIHLAAMQAQAWSRKAQRVFGAEGYQIRDLADEGRIVMLESFDGATPAVH